MQVPDVLAGTGLGVLRVVHVDEPDADALAATAPQPAQPAPPQGGGTLFTIRGPLTTLGRGARNDVVLTDPTISREHARLHVHAGLWWVENVSARNSLWVGATEAAPGATLPVPGGGLLRLGQTTLQLLAPAPETRRLYAEPSGAEGAVETGAPPLLDLGVTMQFALSRRLTPRARVLVVALGALAFLAGAVATVSTAALVRQATLSAHGAGSALAALAIPLVPALGAALLVGFIDRYEREPIVLLVAAFAWGVVIAIPAALVVERALARWLAGAPLVAGGAQGALAAQAALQGLSAGVAEEFVKGAGLVVLLLLLRDEFDNVTDGILYGVLIGAGFALVENFVYFAASPKAELGALILGRVVLGWLGHSTFTALFGAGLGYARETRDRRTQWLAPLVGFVAAVALHSLFDMVDFFASAVAHAPGVSHTIVTAALVAVLLNYLPLFAAQAILWRMLLRALRREEDIVREYLAPEVSAGIVTPDEYVLLQRYQERGRFEHRCLLLWGPRAYLTARDLHQTATGLAFRKWHVALGDRPKPTPRQPEDAYRERIPRLRQRLLRLTAPAVPVAMG
ncbi:MAG TPA: PrsW family glutamic-type intramembrane protease [Ktedonobacterales bacterium]